MNFTDRFTTTMQRLFGREGFPEKIAVAVSGGADSMALVYALADYVEKFSPTTQIFALSVDHRLREEAADEARFVEKSVSELPNVTHQILVWEQGSEQDTRIEERARAARYGLLFGFMKSHDILHLFIGHHQNDQAETFLFRLAKGSGLDGLACMPEIGKTSHNGSCFVACRPFLNEKKSAILDYVSKFSILYIEDPSNKDVHFARVRLRQSMAVLSDEGLTSKRLYVTAKRMERARDAIEYIVDKEYKNSSYYMNTKTLVLEYEILRKMPFEIVIRIVLKAMEELKKEKGGYGPRLLRVEDLCEDLMSPEPFRKRTLGGIIFERSPKTGDVTLALENP